MHFHSIAILLSLATAALSAPVSGSQGVNQDITLSCRAFELKRDHILKSICLSEVKTEISTLRHLGNKNGMFEWGGSAWWATRSSEPVLEGSVLSAGLFDENDRPVHAKVNLAERIRNINGKLTYSDKPLKSQGVNPDITKSCRDFKLRDGYTLTAICLTEVSTKIDTNHLLGNWKGEFRWGWTNWLKYVYEFPTFTSTNNDPTITATLYTKAGERNDVTVKLAEGIKNINGRLTYVGPANQSSAAI